MTVSYMVMMVQPISTLEKVNAIIGEYIYLFVHSELLPRYKRRDGVSILYQLTYPHRDCRSFLFRT